jgi:hypothetical protein
MKPGALRDKVEELLWDCRIIEKLPQSVIDGYEQDGVGHVFGYQCDEYWKPDPEKRTIDLTVCPYWIDTELAMSRMDEVWDWWDKETAGEPIHDPTYEQLIEAAKQHKHVSFIVTEVKELELSVNGVHDMVFAKNDLGQAMVIAEEGHIRSDITNVVIMESN